MKTQAIKIYFGGVQGVGKTALADRLMKDFPLLEHYSTSEILMDYFGVGGRMELEKIVISQEQRDRILAEFYLNHPNMILDGHFKLATIDLGFFDFFFFIDASDETIIKRRMLDKSRIRSGRALTITEEREEELFFAKKFGVTPIVVINEDYIDAVVTEIKTVISSAFKSKK